MLTYEKIKGKASIFKSLTGLSLAALGQLLPGFEKAEAAFWQRQEGQRRQPRQRRRGGGRKPRLARVEDRLVFILVYFRLYPTQEVLGFLFGIGQPQANEWVHRLTPRLNAALGSEQQLPARQAARPIQRPKDGPRQGQSYSGKKKRHTVKNIVISDKPTKKIKGLGQTQPGKTHDKAATDAEDYHFPKGTKLWKDTGFQGYEPEQTTTFQPKKKPKGGPLTAAEKAHNQTISRERIGVEHSLGGVKVFRIVHEVYRNHKAQFDDLMMETACGLHNLRLDFPLAA
jgi:hypothetical protein